MLLILIFLQFSFFLSNVAALGIMVQSQTILGRPSLVFWTRESSDGNNQLTFDLRFVRPGFVDVGLAIANIQASPSTQSGTTQVVFPHPGRYQLVAVSGPDDTNLGESNQVNILPNAPPSTTSFTSASPTSTCTSTFQQIPSATTSSLHPTSSSAVRNKKNLGAIIGGTIGGVFFLCLLVALAIVCLRHRHPNETRRWTFHRDMMIRPANPAIKPNSPGISQLSSSLDIEQGLPHETPAPDNMIASPNVPRLIKPLPVPPEPLKTRQEDIAERMEEVRNQIMKLERNPGPTQRIQLDDMQKQMSWLQSQMGSPWAMGLTDVTPLGFTHNLAR